MRKQYKEKYIDLELFLSIYKVDGRVNTSEYTGVCAKTKTIYTCAECGKTIEQNCITLKRNNFLLRCKPCDIKVMCMEKYGVSNPSQADEVKSKKKETFMSHYGVDNYSKSEERNSNIANIVAKSNETCLERYGVKNYSQSEECKEKRKDIFRERYGCDYYSQTEECKEKYKQTCLEKYGVPNFGMSLEAHKHRRTHIFYDNQWFDSKPELDYYKACLLANKKIIRHPIKLKYLYNNIVYYYFPDFLVDGQLVEIKGKHFINPETGKWWNPFDHSDDDKAAAKYDCAIMNNVTIIYV